MPKASGQPSVLFRQLADPRGLVASPRVVVRASSDRPTTKQHTPVVVPPPRPDPACSPPARPVPPHPPPAQRGVPPPPPPPPAVA
eukprot:6385547-Alexandrium_andersonii.AAC.1